MQRSTDDDITHIEFLKRMCRKSRKRFPAVIIRWSFALEQILWIIPDAKYGMTTEQIFEAFKAVKKELGVKEFGIHSFLASNTIYK